MSLSIPPGSTSAPLPSSSTPSTSAPSAPQNPSTTPPPSDADTAFTTGGQLSAGAAAWSADRPAGTVGPLGLRLGGAANLEGERLLKDVSGLLSGWVHRGHEKSVIALLRAASPAALNFALRNLDAHELIEAVNDHFWGPKNRTDLFALLGTEKLGTLDIATRAHLIRGVQRGNTDSQREGFVRDVFVNTKGADLTALKNAIDAGGDHYDLMQLINHDIDAPHIRQEMLSHLRTEAQGQSPARPKVLSDIDDTLYANLKDKRFPKGTRYPGVVAFYAHLSGFRADPTRPEPMVTFLTARPEDPSGLVEEYTHSALAKLGVGNAAVLSGDVAHLVGNDAIAVKKKENFNAFKALYPEYKTVFVGDSGQGDKQLTEPDVTFIHNVNQMPAAEQQALKQQGVYVFDTYAGAAVQAFDLGLLDETGLRAVAQSARDAVGGINFAAPTERTARFFELNQDLAAVNQRLTTSPVAMV